MNRLSLILIAGLILAGCSKQNDQDGTQEIRPVKYWEVGGNTLTGQHSYTGLAKAQQEAKLSFKVSGTINEIKVKVGDRVRQGQLLATIDATDYQVSLNQSLANVQNSKAQVESAQAQMESAKASYIAAESNYQRFEKLYETNSISLSDFEQAKSSYLSAAAAYKAAQTQVEAAKAASESSESIARSASNQVAYTRIIAPFDGIITSVQVEPNEIVGQGNPIVVINSESNPDVQIGVPESSISEIRPDENAIVIFNSIHHKEFSGKVHEIGYSSSGSTYPVTIRLTENDERIRPGMPASATFTFKDHHSSASALIVPPSAVGEDGEGNFVYVIVPVDDAYICKKRYIDVGKLEDAGFEVISGLENGVLVASAGLNVLRDGEEVSLYQPN